MRIRHINLLIPLVVALAAALTLLPGRGSAALGLFQQSPLPGGAQDSPLQPSVTPQPTPLTTFQVASPTFVAPPATIVEPGPLPVETFPPLDVPTSVPLPPAALGNPTVSGFLPAPTITNPDDIDSLPLARPPISGGGAPDEAPPVPTPARSSNPALIASVAILNVLWLICGGALVIGGVVFIILLARRRKDA